MENQERRRDVRARITLPTAVVRRGEDVAVRMLDASYRGLFVRMDEPPPVRTLVKLRIDLPTYELVAHAVVVRSVVDPMGRAGVGLRFFALNGQDRVEWESFLSAFVQAARAA
jgi:hypothetical protein